jgi:hypothetical protein
MTLEATNEAVPIYSYMRGGALGLKEYEWNYKKELLLAIE